MFIEVFAPAIGLLLIGLLGLFIIHADFSKGIFEQIRDWIKEFFLGM